MWCTRLRYVFSPKISETSMLKKILFFIALTLTGCASGPALNELPLDIHSNQLSTYWVKPTDFKTYEVTFRHAEGKCGKLSDKPEKVDGPYVIYSYLIDSKGKTYERKYLKASPKAQVSLNQLNMMADKMGFVDANVYVPSSVNARKAPVRVSSKLYVVELPSCS